MMTFHILKRLLIFSIRMNIRWLKYLKKEMTYQINWEYERNNSLYKNRIRILLDGGTSIHKRQEIFRHARQRAKHTGSQNIPRAQKRLFTIIPSTTTIDTQRNNISNRVLQRGAERERRLSPPPLSDRGQYIPYICQNTYL